MKDGIYALVDIDSAAIQQQSMHCWTQIPTTMDAIVWWHYVKGNKATVINDPFAVKCFEELKRIIIQFLLMCKNTSEMERGFSILHTNHSKTNPNQYLSSSRNSVLLKQFAKNCRLFDQTEMGVELARKGPKISFIVSLMIIFEPFKVFR